jgi:hypothetical protein
VEIRDLLGDEHTWILAIAVVNFATAIANFLTTHRVRRKLNRWALTHDSR